MRLLTRDELPVATVAQARFLVGKLLVRRLPDGIATGRIVETEAYPPGDAAMHAYRGMTLRNRSLFLEHGHAYVYLCYGVSMMLNVSSEPAGTGAGVLFRALEPIDGVAIMMQHRRTIRLLDIARGPGRLAQALEIDRRLDGWISAPTETSTSRLRTHHHRKSAKASALASPRMRTACFASSPGVADL